MADRATDLLLAEYLQLQKVVEDFDAKALTIKAWSVTLSAAGIVAAYVESESVILIVAAGSALVFWLVEGLWKVAQQAYYPRIRAIERAFSDGSELPPLQIAYYWSRAWHTSGSWRLVFKVGRWPHVMLPHVAVAVCGLALFWLAPPPLCTDAGCCPSGLQERLTLQSSP